MNAGLRVGLVGPLPPPAGGMANQTRQLAELLRKEAVGVHLVATNAAYRPAWIGNVHGLRGLFRLIPYLGALRRMSRKVDVVHVMANSGWAWFLCAAPAINAAVRRNVPVVVNYRGGQAPEFLRQSAARILPVLRQANVVVVPSNFLREVFARYDVDCQVIPNVVNLDTFRPSEQRPGSVRQHVVVTRNLEPIYGIDTAIRAAAILRGEFADLRLSIAGSGDELARLERLVAELDLMRVVRFTGQLQTSEIAALYRDADVTLNPSRVDNTPNSLLEAAACGVPVVSTDVGGVPYLVEHGRSAWLVPPNDPERMAAGIATVLRDASLRARLRDNAAALARSCGWSIVRDQWLNLYQALASEARRHNALGMAHGP